MKLLEAAEAAGMVFKKVASTHGGEYAGPCPKCGGRDRFRLWPEDKGGEGSYWCRGCGAGGDLVQFLVDVRGLNYPSAFREAGRAYPAGYRPPGERAVASFKVPSAQGGERSFQPRVYDPPVETWRLKAEKLVAYAHGKLLDNPEQLDKLAARGLDRHAVEVFRLGWIPGDNGKNAVFRPRSSWGLPMLRKDNGKERMLWIPRGLVIPCIKDGVIQRIRIRRPGCDLKTDRDVRYYILPGSSMEPLLIHPERKGFVVVESELDAMLLSRVAGAVVGVVALGSALAKPGGAAFYYLQNALRILVALDADAAGAKGWAWWNEQFTTARRWPVPLGKDPGEAVALGVDLFQWVMAGLPPTMTLKLAGGHPAETAVPVTADTAPDSGQPAMPLGFYAPSIQELKQLLNRYPFKIRATRTRTSLLWDPQWRNGPVQKRISHLTFFDIDVSEYLDAHPADIIHRGNFDFGME